MLIQVVSKTNRVAKIIKASTYFYTTVCNINIFSVSNVLDLLRCPKFVWHEGVSANPTNSKRSFILSMLYTRWRSPAILRNQLGSPIPFLDRHALLQSPTLEVAGVREVEVKHTVGSMAALNLKSSTQLLVKSQLNLVLPLRCQHRLPSLLVSLLGLYLSCIQSL